MRSRKEIERYLKERKVFGEYVFIIELLMDIRDLLQTKNTTPMEEKLDLLQAKEK